MSQQSIQPRTPGRWGRFGGRYTAEALWEPLEEIARCFDDAIADEAFVARFHRLLDRRVGRPTPLSQMTRIGAQLGA